MTRSVKRHISIGAAALIMQTAAARGVPSDVIAESTVRAHMEFLASDAMNGRDTADVHGLLQKYAPDTPIRSGAVVLMPEEMSIDAKVNLQEARLVLWHDTSAHHARWSDLSRRPIRIGPARLTAIAAPPQPPTGSSEIMLNPDAYAAVAALPDGSKVSFTAHTQETAKLKRTVIFAWFGSEEAGCYGASYFVQKPVVPLDKVVANLEFEMIGRPDAAIAPHTLWLTGWERTNLGPVLAAHGARLVADPHPAQKFFTRSDNFTLARRGVVAQTVSSLGLHADYHQVTDDIAHIDFAHMTEAIQSLHAPIRWLADSNFKPDWVPGGRPE